MIKYVPFTSICIRLLCFALPITRTEGTISFVGGTNWTVSSTHDPSTSNVSSQSSQKSLSGFLGFLNENHKYTLETIHCRGTVSSRTSSVVFLNNNYPSKDPSPDICSLYIPLQTKTCGLRIVADQLVLHPPTADVCDDHAFIVRGTVLPDGGSYPICGDLSNRIWYIPTVFHAGEVTDSSVSIAITNQPPILFRVTVTKIPCQHLLPIPVPSTCGLRYHRPQARSMDHKPRQRSIDNRNSKWSQKGRTKRRVSYWSQKPHAKSKKLRRIKWKSELSRRRISHVSHTSENNTSYTPERRRVNMFEKVLLDQYSDNLGRGDFRIINGRTADIYDWPWMAVLEEDGNPTCGGSLITNLFVLTAAHCVDMVPTKSLKVRLGDWDLDSEDDTSPIIVDVETIMPHYAYDWFSVDSDIALIKLTRTVKLSETINPVCLPVPFHGANKLTEYEVAGWGVTDQKSSDPVRSNILKEIRLSAVTEDKCLLQWRVIQDFRPGKKVITSNMLCAMQIEEEQGICNGDSGGPLIGRGRTGAMVQVGVVSFSFPGRWNCASTPPDIFVKLARFIDWLRLCLAPM